MATDAPITGAPTRAPKTDTRPIRLLATDAQMEIRRIRSIAVAGLHISASMPLEDKDTREAVGHLENILEAIAEFSVRAFDICESIERETI